MFDSAGTSQAKQVLNAAMKKMIAVLFSIHLLMRV